MEILLHIQWEKHQTMEMGKTALRRGRLVKTFVCLFFCVFRLFLCTSGSCREGEDRHSGAYRGGSRWAVMLILISWVYFSSSECRRGSHRMTRERLSVCVCPTCSHFQHLLTRKNAVYIVFINYFPNVKYIIVFAGRLYNTRRWLKQKKWLLKRSSPKKSRYQCRQFIQRNYFCLNVSDQNCKCGVLIFYFCGQVPVEIKVPVPVEKIVEKTIIKVCELAISIRCGRNFKISPPDCHVHNAALNSRDFCF